MVRPLSWDHPLVQDNSGLSLGVRRHTLHNNIIVQPLSWDHLLVQETVVSVYRWSLIEGRTTYIYSGTSLLQTSK